MGRKKKEQETTDDLNFDFDVSSLPQFDDMDLAGFTNTRETEITNVEATRYIKPPLRPIYKMDENVLYGHAAELVKACGILHKNERFNAIVSGDFIFGDFIFGYLAENELTAETLTISTLSMNFANVDMLAALLENDIIGELNLIVSDYFYSHERNTIVKYLYEQLDDEKNRFQLAVAGTHTKTVHFETNEGDKIVIHGSANLRSSANIEQFTIEENESLFNFYDEKLGLIIDKYKTINKSIRVSKLWETINRKKFKD